MPTELNWWIGIIFSVGSACFLIASLMGLAPWLGLAWKVDSSLNNAIYFAGSVPFTTAAYLQLFQAANAGEFRQPRTRGSSHLWQIIGWQPGQIGWLSCMLQFIGTLLFNINTFDAMYPSRTWWQQDLLVWTPDLIGSILFLASGYMAFAEVCHANWYWKPNSISWWVVSINLIGCIGFMISALLAVILPGINNQLISNLSVLFTLIGACGFLFGSLLMLPETALVHDPQSIVAKS